MIPRLRVIPAAPAQLAADAGAPFIVVASVDVEALQAQSASVGSRAEAVGGTVRLVASRNDLERLCAALREQ